MCDCVCVSESQDGNRREGDPRWLRAKMADAISWKINTFSHSLFRTPNIVPQRKRCKKNQQQTVYSLKLTADKKRLDPQTHQDADFLLQQHVAPAHRLLLTGLMTVILLCLIGHPAVDGRLRCTYTKFGYIALNLHTS